jgi:hypothetical protein
MEYKIPEIAIYAVAFLMVVLAAIAARLSLED